MQRTSENKGLNIGTWRDFLWLCGILLVLLFLPMVIIKIVIEETLKNREEKIEKQKALENYLEQWR